jgi:hypothetical protein
MHGEEQRRRIALPRLYVNPARRARGLDRAGRTE